MSGGKRVSVILAVLLLGAASAHGDEPVPEQPPFGQGTHAFRAMFKFLGATPLERMDQLWDDPAGKVLVVLGDTQFLDPNLSDIRRFIQQGGAVLIATDRPTSPAMYDKLGVRVSGPFVQSPPDHAYRRSLTECPLVQEFAPRNAGRVSHLIFSGLSRGPGVATNRPSQLRTNNGTPVATLYKPGPGDDLPIPGVGQRRFPNHVLFGITGPIYWIGKLLVLADHSVFINDMILQTDNDNFAFADNVANWLTDNGKRKQVLFYDEGGQQNSFEVSLKYPEPQLPPIEALVPLANRFLAGLESENAFNTMLLRAVGGRGTVVRSVLLTLTAALLMFGLYRFLHARHRVDPKVLRLPTAVAAPQPTLEQRHQAVLARGNLSEAARELARQAFLSLGVPSAAGATMPAFTVAGSWWQRLVWGRRVRRLWELAALGRGRRVSPTGLRRLATALQELRAAAAGGKLHFAAAK